MRRLLIPPLMGILLLTTAAAPVAAFDPTKLGPDAFPPGEVTTPSEGPGTEAPPLDGAGPTIIAVSPTTIPGPHIVSDELLRMHRAKGGPLGAPDPL